MKFGCNKIMICVFLLTISDLSFSAVSISKSVPLSAHIDNEMFYSYRVTDFGFKQPFLSIKYDLKHTQFISQSTYLLIKTDIPVGFNSGYEITPTVLDSTCEDASTNVVEDGFANYYLDGKVLQVDNTLIFDSFNNSGSLYLSDKREFSIKFEPTPNLDIYKSRCKGSATVLISLAF